MSAKNGVSKANKCVVPGCRILPGVKYHRIPKKAWRAKRWLDAINSPILNNLETEQLYKYHVCSNHFEKSDYSIDTNQSVLQTHVKPHKNLPETIIVSETKSHNTIEQIYGWNVENLGDNVVNSHNQSSLPSLPKLSEPLHSPTITEFHNAGLTKNPDEIVESTGSFSELLDGGQNGGQQPAVEIVGAEFEEMERLARQTRRKQIPSELRGYIRKLKEKNSSLERTVKLLKKKHKTMSQRWRRTSVKLQRVKELFRANHVRNWDKLTYTQQTIFSMTLQNAGKHPKGMRFTEPQKVSAVGLAKRLGQSRYDFLSQNIILPGSSTVNLVVDKIPCSTGLTQAVLTKLHDFGAKMQEIDKNCILMWDEVQLDLHLQYSKSSDQIVGFEDWGYRRRAGFANHGLVFLLRGVNSGWTLPVFYGFCAHQTNQPDLARCIKFVVEAVEKTGFHILGTVCDQSSSNRSTINYLINKSNIQRFNRGEHPEDTIIIGDTTLIVLMDPPHVLKSTRNNIVTKPLEMNYTQAGATKRKLAKTDDVPGNKQKLAKWSVIQTAYKIDRMVNPFYPQMDKLSDKHVDESDLKKMKVSHAAQILSNSVAECIKSFAKPEFVGPSPDLKIEKDEGENTADACKFFNDVFDSVNGSSPPEPGIPPLRFLVTDSSPQHTFWQNAIERLKKMRFVDPISLSPPKHPSYSISGWLMTLQGFQKLWQVLKSKGFTELRPRFINQDALENFFGLMRAFAGQNDSPSCWQFGGNYKALLINKLNDNKRIGANCEETREGGLLFTLESLLTADSQSPLPTMDLDDEVENVFPPVPSQTYAFNNSGGMLSKPADKIKTKLGQSSTLANSWETCQGCKVSFLRPRGMDQRSDFDLIYEKILRSLHIVMPSICHWRNISVVLFDRVKAMINDSWMWCPLHRGACHEQVIKLVVDDFLINWCTLVNRHLTGKTNHLRNLPIFKQATDMYEKLYKRPKK